MNNRPLHVIASDGRILGQIQAHPSEIHNLVFFAGPTGWRVWECLSQKEKQRLGLKSDDIVRFSRVTD